jgi:hypothetical protein
MKKSFLTSVAALAASIAIDASAALPESLTKQLDVKAEYVAQAQELAKAAQNPFVLERPDSIGNTNVADHYSHRSHASHASHRSHVSSRY